MTIEVIEPTAFEDTVKPDLQEKDNEVSIELHYDWFSDTYSSSVR